MNSIISPRVCHTLIVNYRSAVHYYEFLKKTNWVIENNILYLLYEPQIHQQQKKKHIIFTSLMLSWTLSTVWLYLVHLRLCTETTHAKPDKHITHSDTHTHAQR